VQEKISGASRRYFITLGFALFAMFFGAGNLIFPPALGRIFGDQFAFSIAGFLLTGAGLPLLGILAVAKAEGGLDKIASRVDPLIAKILTVAVMLSIGPFLAIPRTCATTYEMGIAPAVPQIGTWTFSFIYFAVVFFFAVNPRKVVGRIGKILTPLLFLSLLIIIVKGIFTPISFPAATGNLHPFGNSLIEGYQTMDLMAATVFGIIILNELKGKKVFEKKEQISMIVKAGLISASALALIYGGLVYVGATASGMTGEIARTDLLIHITRQLLGAGGIFVLGLAVSMACLTTAIGLTAVCGQYFSGLSKGRINYKVICLIISAIGFVLSNAGVEMIVRIAVPVLTALYPAVMVLVILTLLGKKFSRKGIWRGAAAGAFTFGLIEAMHRTGIEPKTIGQLFDVLPLKNQGLCWLLPALILGALGALIRGK
jgi:LIVCS family branched-chain amino acid:cation transporter